MDIEERVYWRRHFPWEVVGAYLDGVGAGQCIEMRELAVQWRGSDGEIHFERNRTYHTLDELRQAVCNGSVPRIESGCFFAGAARKQRRNVKGQAYPVEFRIDVDITDYDGSDGQVDVTCVEHNAREGACDKCWRTRLAPAIFILEKLLSEVLGLEHVIRVWSGNKGFHLLCVDRECLRWDDDNRKALLERLLADPQDRAVDSFIYDDYLWPLFQRQYLAGDAPCQLRTEWLPRCDDVSYEGKTARQALEEVQKVLWGGLWDKYRRQLLRTLYWPRVDKAPLKSDHLLKVPFCVHERTSKVSIPLVSAGDFLPSSAPVRTQVLDGSYDMGPAIKYMRDVLDSARHSGAHMRPARFPETSPYLLSVDWTGKRAEDYASSVAAAARVFADHYETLVVVPDHEWHLRLRAWAQELRVAVADESGAVPEGTQVLLISHAREGQCQLYLEHQCVVLAFDSQISTDAPLVATRGEHMITTAKRLRQFCALPGMPAYLGPMKVD
jgi:DNA primase catalytic subunit